jgi:hypothetical protein
MGGLEREEEQQDTWVDLPSVKDLSPQERLDKRWALMAAAEHILPIKENNNQKILQMLDKGWLTPELAEEFRIALAVEKYPHTWWINDPEEEDQQKLLRKLDDLEKEYQRGNISLNRLRQEMGLPKNPEVVGISSEKIDLIQKLIIFEELRAMDRQDLLSEDEMSMLSMHFFKQQVVTVEDWQDPMTYDRVYLINGQKLVLTQQELLRVKTRDFWKTIRLDIQLELERILMSSRSTAGTTSTSMPTSPAPSLSSMSRGWLGVATGRGSSFVSLREMPGFY